MWTVVGESQDASGCAKRGHVQVVQRIPTSLPRGIREYSRHGEGHITEQNIHTWAKGPEHSARLHAHRGRYQHARHRIAREVGRDT